MAGHSDDLEITVATKIAQLTVDDGGSRKGRQESGPRPISLEPRIDLSKARRYLSRYCIYPWKVRRTKADLLHVLDHSYGHILLSKPHRPTVVTVHDLFPMMILKLPASPLRGRVRNWLLQRTLEGLRQADAWIVATDWLRAEFCDWLGMDAQRRVHVIPFGVDDEFFLEPEEDRLQVRDFLGLPPGAFVVLHVGSVVPRKNLSAVAATVQGLRERGLDAWLLQIGGDLSPEQRRDLTTRGISQVTAARGPAPEGSLRLAYRASDVLLFPSHYEGFGLPVLEAMASGLPVVTSGAGGLAEVAGEAAVVVSGREAEPYVDSVARLAQDTAWRDELVERGLERASRFRWLHAAKKTAEVYRTLA
jgi:glycosyltransferase involved in cell wall biosynthesis